MNHDAGVQNETTWKNLSHDDSVAGVVVTTKDGDRFVLSLEDAINACRSADKANEFMRQLGGVFGMLTDWLNERPDKIDRAYLSLSDEGLDFTVIQRAGGFDPEIDESLVDLDIRIAKTAEFDLIKLDVMSLPYCPDENVRSFVRHHPTWMKQMTR